MITTTRRCAVATAALAAALLAAALLAACGGSGSGSGPKAGTLIPQMQSAVAQAQSVRMTGNIIENGQHLVVDLTFVKPTALAGTFSQGSKSFTILATRGKAYFKVDQKFLAAEGAPAALCSTLCGKYVLLPGSQASSMTSQLSLSGLYGQVFHKFPTASVAGDSFTPTTYHSQAAYSLTVSDGTLVVARSSPHYPLDLISTNGQGSIQFSEWNSASVPGPPPASEVINLSQLG